MKIFSRVILILLILGAITAYRLYTKILVDNVASSESIVELQIPSGSSFDDVFSLLKERNILESSSSFKFVAGLMKYNKETVPSGYFVLENDWSNKEIIQVLRGGFQKPLNLTFNNVRLPEDLAGQLSSKLEVDSMSILNALRDTMLLRDLSVNRETAMTLFIPNTYQIYWNTNAQKLLERMKKEHDRFWSKNDRLAKAKDIGLSPKEVYTLASIVEKETLVKDEKATVAGVYMNRLNKGILLQADPTVVFAVKKFDLRRVLNKHLAVDSPYNTYKNAGLPPGPICMPSIGSIDAVLSYEKHSYIYFCAKPEGGGRHAFARNLSEHNNNANKYRAWLRKNKIR